MKYITKKFNDLLIQKYSAYEDLTKIKNRDGFIEDLFFKDRLFYGQNCEMLCGRYDSITDKKEFFKVKFLVESLPDYLKDVVDLYHVYCERLIRYNWNPNEYKGYELLGNYIYSTIMGFPDNRCEDVYDYFTIIRLNEEQYLETLERYKSCC